MTTPAPSPSLPNSDTVSLALADLEQLCRDAVRAAGGSAQTAVSLASATVAAERRGRSEVGAAHLLDYLDAMAHGRLDGSASPRVVTARAGMLVVDAAGGTAQAAFDSVRDDLVSRARENGIAMLSIHRSFTAGEIGHYTTRLAEQGLVALMGSNSPALVAALGAREAVTGTNPLSFALPHPDGPRMFDQAASATAWVNIRDAADRGESIPAGWALTPDGEETTDAQAGMNGALLPFGGAKAGNIAFMVEMLAVLSGGAFSLDAPPFDAGEEQPGVGLFAIAIDPDAFDPAYAERVESHLRGIAREHGADFGRRKTPRTHVDLPVAVHDALTESARGGAPA
jgi:(2R)-3-sulfolactate dehydrogenase (NADP+)